MVVNGHTPLNTPSESASPKEVYSDHYYGTYTSFTSSSWFLKLQCYADDLISTFTSERSEHRDHNTVVCTNQTLHSIASRAERKPKPRSPLEHKMPSTGTNRPFSKILHLQESVNILGVEFNTVLKVRAPQWCNG